MKIADKYKNQEGVYIDAHTDKRGKDHIDFYDRDPSDKDHGSIHINWDSNSGKGSVTDTTSGSKEPSLIDCFLTTACMRHLNENFDDNCNELTVLRWFRDKFVSKEDVEHYYKVAPIIVDAINKTPKHEVIYKDIYENVIRECVDAIYNGDYEFAYNKYKNSIISLEGTYARKELQNRLVKTLRS